MTREEAIRITEQCAMQYPYVFVQCLEALGLLKFDEVKKPDFNNVYKVTKEVLEAIKALLKIDNKNNFVSTIVGDFVGPKSDEIKKEGPETVRLPVDDRTYEIGSDTYDVKIESIVKVLNKAGYRIYKGGYGREL